MHTYSTDNDLRPKVYGVVALISYFGAILVGIFFNLVVQNLALSIAIGAPSWPLVFGLMLTVYDRWLWNTWIALRKQIVGVNSPV